MKHQTFEADENVYLFVLVSSFGVYIYEQYVFDVVTPV